MTTTERTTETSHVDAADAAATEPELCWIDLSTLAPHPDNPRTTLGDLTELTRSIRSQGVLEPLVVLPANTDHVHLIVAGRRRHAAAVNAGNIERVLAVVRAMTPIQVIEAGLSENGNRTDLTVGEEVRAIERLMSLENGLTPAKLCRRIGRSQTWVRSRMAVTVLPARWQTALDNGQMSLAAAEAAATLADLGPEHLDIICEQLTQRNWGDPTRAVANYRTELARDDAYNRAVTVAVGKHRVVFTSDQPAPANAKRVSELFDTDTAAAHTGEPCHAVVVRRTTWGDGHETFAVCTEPRRHNPNRVNTTTGSELAATNTRPATNGGDDSNAKRKGRVARIAHLTETFAKPRGGMAQADLTRIALRGLIFEAGREAITYAATILGHDQPRDIAGQDLLDTADSTAALVKVAGAVAFGLAETHMYWSATSSQCRDYLDALTASGWTPDEWTANTLTHNPNDNTDTDADPACDRGDDDLGDEDPDDADDAD